jgi:hypothetical protein
MTACSQISYYEAAILCCLLLPFISGKGRGLRAYISGKGGDCDSKSSGKERGLRPYFPGKEGGGGGCDPNFPDEGRGLRPLFFREGKEPATLTFSGKEGACDPDFSGKGKGVRPWLSREGKGTATRQQASQPLTSPLPCTFCHLRLTHWTEL